MTLVNGTWIWTLQLCQRPHTHILQPGTRSSRLFQQRCGTAQLHSAVVLLRGPTDYSNLMWGSEQQWEPGTLKVHKLVPFWDVRENKVLWQCA